MAIEPIYLDRNENNYGPAPKCLDVLKNVSASTLSSYTKAYTRGVKSSLSERLASDFKVEEKQVLLGYGAEDILKQVVQCYLKEGEKLMIPSYSWWYYKEIANEVNGVNDNAQTPASALNGFPIEDISIINPAYKILSPVAIPHNIYVKYC